MNKTFHFDQLNKDFAYLDACPDYLFDEVVLLRYGKTEDLIPEILRWEADIKQGNLPILKEDCPIPHSLLNPIWSELEDLQILPFCAQSNEMAEEVLLDVLKMLNAQIDAFRHKIQEELRALEREELRKKEQKRKQAEARKAKKNTGSAKKGKSSKRTNQRSSPSPVTLSPKEKELLRKLALNNAQKHCQNRKLGTLQKKWEEKVRLWSSLKEVFGELGDMLGLGWDLSHGIFHHVGWSNIVRLKHWMSNIPELKKLIETLGRLSYSDTNESVIQQVFEPISIEIVEELEERVPNLPMEMKGIERGGDLERMLPSEALMIRHPLLRKLWLKKYVEHSLLSYYVEGTQMVEHKKVVTEELSVEKERPKPIRGPIIVMIDTSGSMSGLPEQVAKAVTLEAMIHAHSQKRACYLMAFSGPGQVEEQELSLKPEGIQKLLQFLGMSFHGGTDGNVPLERAISLIQTEKWRKADLLLISDGYWPVAPSLKNNVSKILTEKGATLHGLLIGTQHHGALHELCSPLHQFSSWKSMVETI